MRPDNESGKKNKSGIVVPGTIDAGAVLELFRALMGWQNKWVDSAILCAIILFLAGYCIFCFRKYIVRKNEIRNKHKWQVKRLGKKRDNSNTLEEIKQIEKQKEEEDEVYEQDQAALKKWICRVSLISGTGIVIAAAALIFLWMPEQQETKGAGSNAPVYDSNSTPPPEPGTITREEESDKMEAGTPTPEQQAEMGSKTFLLEELRRSRILTDEQESRVFYVTETDKEACKNMVEQHMADLRGIGRKSTLHLASQIEKNVIAQASEDEKIFRRKREEAMEYGQKGDYTGWRYSIPSSGTLEQDIMAKREQFWTVGEGEIVKFDGQLCFMMASSNQLLAMEYALQGGIPETVIFYYTESIIWLEEALTYRDLSRETAASYKNNLKGRYKDISDYIDNNLNAFTDKGEALELKEKAWAIYRAM